MKTLFLPPVKTDIGHSILTETMIKKKIFKTRNYTVRTERTQEDFCSLDWTVKTDI